MKLIEKIDEYLNEGLTVVIKKGWDSKSSKKEFVSWNVNKEAFEKLSKYDFSKENDKQLSKGFFFKDKFNLFGVYLKEKTSIKDAFKILKKASVAAGVNKLEVELRGVFSELNPSFKKVDEHLNEIVDYKKMSLKTLYKKLNDYEMKKLNATTQNKKLNAINQIGIIKQVIADKQNSND